MAHDARVRYTQMVIKESFLQLHAKKPIAQITVKEICDRALINRSTFYRNYIDVYDLKDQIEDEYLQEIVSLIHDKKLENAEQTVLYILLMMKDNQDRFTALHDVSNSTLLSRIIKNCFEDRKDFIRHMAPNLSTKEIQWYVQYISSGCAAIMIDWVKSGMKESPYEVAKFISSLVLSDSSVLNMNTSILSSIT